MKKFTQTILAGDTSGQRGNCFATCIGCILELHPTKLPNFCNSDNWREATNEYLASWGLVYVDVGLPGDARDELVRYWGHHVISGDGPRGYRHSVVGRQGKIVWDPHPSGGGLLGRPWDWEYGLLVRVL